jgi:hypothetical protein
VDAPGPEDIAAIIAKNPRSARPTALGSLALLDVGPHRLLPTVKRCFIMAYGNAGKTPPNGAFVRVWNLFDLCDPNLDNAINTIKRIPSAPTCGSENQTPPLVWVRVGAEAPATRRFQAPVPRQDLPFRFLCGPDKLMHSHPRPDAP